MVRCKESDIYVAISRLYGPSTESVANDIELKTVVKQHMDDGYIEYVNNFHYFKRTLTYRQYELSNHLGNVLTTVLDRKTAVVDTNSTGDTVMYYIADVYTAQCYYAFGSSMPGLAFQHDSCDGYRFGFNSMESAGGNESDDILFTEFRVYDSRMGRWFSIDPESDELSEFSPYHFAINSPMKYNDPDGDMPRPLESVWEYVKTNFNKIMERTVGDIAGSGLLDFALGTISNGVKEGLRRVGNSVNIGLGLFRSDGNRTAVGQAWQILSRFTWNLPSTLISFSTVQFYNIFLGGRINNISYKRGITIIEIRCNSQTYFYLPFGNFVFTNDRRNLTTKPGVNTPEDIKVLANRQKAASLFGPLWPVFELVDAIFSNSTMNRGPGWLATALFLNRENQKWQYKKSNGNPMSQKRRERVGKRASWRPLKGEIRGPVFQDYNTW